MHEKHIGVPLGIIRFLRPGKEREPRRRLAMLPDLVRRLHAHAVHRVDEMLRDTRVDDGRILSVVGTLLQKIVETFARFNERRRHIRSWLLRHNEPCMQLLERMHEGHIGHVVQLVQSLAKRR